MITTEFTWRVDGNLTDATSVVLADPGDTFGIKRNDTEAVVVAADTAMDHAATGVYRYTFDPPVAGLEYTRWVKVVYNGIPYFFTMIFRDEGALPTSALFTWEQFVNRWGLKNIVFVSNKQNKADIPNYIAVQDAFDYATAEVYSSQKGGPYAVPLDFSAFSGKVPAAVSRWAMIIAYADLYNVRGQDDRNRVGNKMSKQLSDVYVDMSMYRAGLKQLDAAGAVATDSSFISVGAIALTLPPSIRAGWGYVNGVLCQLGGCYV